MTESANLLSERDDVEMMLPWYASGKLDAADVSRVEQWLQKDASLRRQLVLIQEEQSESIRVSEAMRVPSSLSVERTFQAVMRPSPAVAGLSGFSTMLKSLFDGAFGAPLRWTAAAAGLALLVQAATIGYLLTSRQDTTYVPASGTQAGPTAAGTFALVRFADAATAKDIAAALAELDLSIVDGPRTGALYRVRIGAAGMSDSARDQRIAAIRAKTGIVTFVSSTP